MRHMEIEEMLDEIKRRAQKDAKLRVEFLQTREQENPLSAFCAKCRELGYPVYEMETSSLRGRSFMRR